MGSNPTPRTFSCTPEFFEYLRRRVKETAANSYCTRIKVLSKLGNLDNPEKMKTLICTYPVSEARKELLTNAYDYYVRFKKLNWDKPRFIREDRRNQAEVSRFASWYDPETMTLRNKQTLQTLIDNNSGNIPCNCPTCSSSPYLMENNFAEYNQKVKSHYMHCREQEMKEIYQAIEKQDSLMGFDKLKRSPLRNLVDVIPS